MGLFSTKCSICGSLEHSTSNCPHGNLSLECNVCGSKDHATKDCPHNGFSTKCKVCGSKNHATKDCPHGAFSTECKVCGSKEHATKDCPHSVFSTECKVCGSKNHATKDCPHGIIERKVPKETRRFSDSTSSEDSGLTNIIAWLIGVAIIVFIVVWLAVNIVLPVILLNSALILLILATFFRQKRKIFAGLSLIGGCYMILDVLNGWFSANFVHNVVKDSDWIIAFIFINALAIGLSTWFLVQPIFAIAKLKVISEKNKSILLRGVSILLVAAATLSTPIIYYCVQNPFSRKWHYSFKSENYNKSEISQVIGKIPDRPNPPTLVTDFAEVFSSNEQFQLEQKLVDLFAQTSTQIAVVTVPDLKGLEISDFAFQLGTKWSIGGEKFDNGILILFKPKTSSSKGAVFIALGNNLAGVIPDTVVNRIIVEKEMIPYFAKGDIYGGFVNAINELTNLIKEK